jgi:hypothetical protein
MPAQTLAREAEVERTFSLNVISEIFPAAPAPRAEGLGASFFLEHDTF